ncbi:MAG: hypothetical protein F6K18_14685 [Okeania sp. SIO2C2]|uniref:hypothetical protein n=1 Tax=Okeania sp. SIO2C2 TaxID=2607787 RepID=UPI0013BD7758|nr:hypothetical protein [Okeania sp. SIO2C2]NEP87965.1 hypothetical protein [Okeania sp. SIO2C2]
MLISSSVNINYFYVYSVGRLHATSLLPHSIKCRKVFEKWYYIESGYTVYVYNSIHTSILNLPLTPYSHPGRGYIMFGRVSYIEEGDRRQETGDRRKITWGF